MKNLERTAIVRVFSDLIKADRIIDTGEMAFYDAMRKKYGFKQSNEVEAQSMNFADAVAVLKKSDESLRMEILADCAVATVSDGFCSRSEALLFVALRQVLGMDSAEFADVVSVPKRNFGVDDATILYVETRFDAAVNRSIVDNYRNINKDFLFAGFQFVYIPDVIRHYKEADKTLLKKIISFLSPSFPEEETQNVITDIETMTTVDFCKDILCNRLGLDDMRDINPSLLIKIGNDYVGDAEYSNFLRAEIEDDFTSFVNMFVDDFSSMLSSDTLTVSTGRETDSQYLYYGFYKQLLDIFLQRRNIRSRIVIDFAKEEILLPDINRKLNGLSRKDKALYVLFLLLIEDNGFSFSLPKSKVQMEKYASKTDRLQRQYEMVYRLMGGSMDTVPDICSAEIRRPIFSRVKKSLMSMSEMLYNVNDYLITRNSYGIYNINVSMDIIYVQDHKISTLIPLKDSSIIDRIRGVREKRCNVTDK